MKVDYEIKQQLAFIANFKMKKFYQRSLFSCNLITKSNSKHCNKCFLLIKAIYDIKQNYLLHPEISVKACLGAGISWLVKINTSNFFIAK